MGRHSSRGLRPCKRLLLHDKGLPITVRNRPFLHLLAVLALVGLVIAAYALWARPYQLHWGATTEEINRPMPGDELDPQPLFLATRAITIEGTPAEIWPWLLQMGYGRAGFYGYDILENLGSSRGIHSADRILPEFQHFAVGDPVPISPVANMVFYAIEPNQYLIWAGDAAGEHRGGFTWALYPLDATHTRLVNRIRWSHHWTQPSLLALDLFTEFADHLAVREILQGVKDRVEGRPIPPMMWQNLKFGLYVAAAILFLAALIGLLWRPLTGQRWLAGLAAGMAWLLTWYAPIPVWGAALLELLVIAGLYAAFRRRPSNKQTLKETKK